MSALRLDLADNEADIVKGRIFYVEVHVPCPLDHVIFQIRKKTDAEEHQKKGENHTFVEAGADGKSHTRRGPEARRRGQALDLLPVRDDDGAGT